MKKIVALMLLWLSVADPCFAQGAITGLVSTEQFSNAPQLFRLNPEQYNHHFEFPLPQEGILQVDFLRLSDWGNKNQIQTITQAAASQVKMLADSFSNSYSTKLLAMNIPIDAETIAISYAENEAGKRQLAYKNGTYYQLKTGYDTIRVIKNIGIRTKPLTDSGLVQVQYTFILKELNDIIALSSNTEIINNLGNTVDEEVNKYRSRWSNQDGRSHQLSLKYDPAAGKMKKQEINEATGIFKYIDIYVGIGAITYTNNNVSPYFEESIAFRLPSRAKMQPFVGINVSGFGYFNIAGQQSNYTSYNVEFGYCKRAPFMPQKSSMMLGLMRMKTPNDKDYNLFHMGFTLGFNSFMSGGFNIGSDFKKNSKTSIMGVNLKFNL